MRTCSSGGRRPAGRGLRRTVLRRYRVGMESFGADLQTVVFEGGGPAEVFANAAAWLAPRDGAVFVQDVGWHQFEDDPPWHMLLYYIQEKDHR